MQKNKKQPYYPTVCPKSIPCNFLNFTWFELLDLGSEVKIDSTGLSQCNKLYHFRGCLESDADLIVNTRWEPILNMLRKYCWQVNML
jgi:hypothetical protein